MHNISEFFVGWMQAHNDPRLLVYGTALPLLAAGLPIRALGASEREATNISLGAWTGVAAAIARLKLLIDGEEHLWSDRPAVFIFNHQSGLELVLLLKMLLRDFTGIAKQELRNNPIFGVLAFGEGWHNNHHHYPGSARQGFYWWEVDLTWYFLRTLQALGLIWDVRPIPDRIKTARLEAATGPKESAP